jgi:PAS domain S-box-containing protein
VAPSLINREEIAMVQEDKVNVLLVDDQPAKLLAYETVLQDLGENLIKASSAREALQHLLKMEVAVLLVDVCMPELDGFQLAAMIREHPRFKQTAIIFVSAIHMTDVDRLRGYEMGAVDYVPVPVVPEVLRAKVKVFAELYRKTRQLEQLNADLERRVAERTAELEASNAQLRESERRRSLALAAGQMGSWAWDPTTGECQWDAGQCRILGVEPTTAPLTVESIRPFIHPNDLAKIEAIARKGATDGNTLQTEVRIVRPNGQTRWCICAAAMTTGPDGGVTSVSGVTIDITELKEAEERRTLLMKEVDHRARNALAIVQSIIRLTKAPTIEAYIPMVEGRIKAVSNAHALLSESRWEGADLKRLAEEELAPYRSGSPDRIVVRGPSVLLTPETAQSIALVLHELATNAAKYGALSLLSGRVVLSWQWQQGKLDLQWEEFDGPAVQQPATIGYGTKVISDSVTLQLGGTARFDWRSYGLRFAMSITVDCLRKSREDFPQGGHAAANFQGNGSTGAAEGQRILLVEDEIIVGMMMREFLTEIGFHVVGPFGKVSEATEVISREQLRAAVLDVNLKGEMIYGLAEKLSGQGVPLVFVTGYAPETIDARFANVPVLQKPVDSAALRRVLGDAAA